ncbi:MAG TPA: DUF2239 family protein [Steroidobacteraceae bacterium]|jgi:hypothetical protein|nr:DUF2239 family protein [Steroidobacteraceae bacterium]
MNDPQIIEFTAFVGSRRLASGPLDQVAVAAKKAVDRGTQQPVLIYNDHTGRAIDIDSRGSDGEILARLAQPPPPSLPRGRGRPKLGVVAREITLLPRHWQWLGSQPGGASVAIRKLVEAARRSSQQLDQRRQRHEAAYHFMSAMAGNLANFEEASRALFAGDRERFSELVGGWPTDIRDHAVKLAFAEGPSANMRHEVQKPR